MTSPTAPTKPVKFTITRPLDLSKRAFSRRALTHGITVHCTATKPTVAAGVREVDGWHRAKGWAGVGYHFIVRRNGVVETGRPLDMKGAHAADGGRNATHIGVSLEGGVGENPKHTPGSPWNGSGAEANFTAAQGDALRALIVYLEGVYKTKLPIEGHRDIPGVNKACPSFNAKHWQETGEFRLD